MPNQSVTDELHQIFFTKHHERIRWVEVVAVRSGAGVNPLPLHIILGGDLIELGLDQSDFPCELIRSRGFFDLPGSLTAIDGGAHYEVIGEPLLQR